MMKFLMAITSAAKLEMAFVILSKLRPTFEKVSLVGILHSLLISASVSESTRHFQFCFDFHYLI